MQTIQAKPITHEAFAPFGQFYPMNQPTGYALCGEIHRFYPDRLTASSEHNIGYSP
ncbi:MAG: Ureidoglycolate hydrolase, partial [Clostridia bacterium]|nr:Ureidoglycolate hydrolase [Clostridia bacterium]